MSYFAHDSAYLDDGCRIGDGTRIWHFTHVMSGATIGRGCNIGQNVVVSPDVVIVDLAMQGSGLGGLLEAADRDFELKLGRLLAVVFHGVFLRETAAKGSAKRRAGFTSLGEAGGWAPGTRPRALQG